MKEVEKCKNCHAMKSQLGMVKERLSTVQQLNERFKKYFKDHKLFKEYDEIMFPRASGIRGTDNGKS